PAYPPWAGLGRYLVLFHSASGGLQRRRVVPFTDGHRGAAAPERREDERPHTGRHDMAVHKNEIPHRTKDYRFFQGTGRKNTRRFRRVSACARSGNETLPRDYIPLMDDRRRGNALGSRSAGSGWCGAPKASTSAPFWGVPLCLQAGLPLETTPARRAA